MRLAWVKNLVNLVYPLTCLICHNRLDPLAEKPLCRNCWQAIEYNLPPFCPGCGKHLPAEGQDRVRLCQACQRSRYFFKAAYSACIYEGVIKECILLLKYKNKLSLVDPLAKIMSEFADNFIDLASLDCIVPVPLYSSKLRQRGFNQAQLLARRLSQASKKELKDKALIKIIPSAPQAGLSRIKRLSNLKGSFAVRPGSGLENKSILLVDDVLTTASTANECAKVLLRAGVKKVQVFTLAKRKLNEDT